MLTFKLILFPAAQSVSRLIVIWDKTQSSSERSCKALLCLIPILNLASNLFFSGSFAVLTLVKKPANTRRSSVWFSVSASTADEGSSFLLPACISVGVCVAADQNRLGNWCGLKPTVWGCWGFLNQSGFNQVTGVLHHTCLCWYKQERWDLFFFFFCWQRRFKREKCLFGVFF